MTGSKDQITELRHVLSFVQSHLDKHDVRIRDMEYDIVSHTSEKRGSPEPDFDVTGTTVQVTVEYTFPYDDE